MSEPMKIAIDKDHEIENLRNELERERIRLAACGAVALANTKESAEQCRVMKDEYLSDSLTHVMRAVDREMKYRDDLDQVLAEAVWAMTICDAYFKSGHCSPAGDAIEKVTAFLRSPDVLDYLARVAQKENNT